MDFLTTELKVLFIGLSIVVPFLGALLAYLSRSIASLRGFFVIITSLVLGVIAVLFVVNGPFKIYASDIGQINVVNMLITYVDLALLVILFIYGWIRQSFLVGILSLAQLGLLVWYDFFLITEHAYLSEQVVFNVDGLALVMIVIICIIGSLIGIYSLKYMKDWEHHHHDNKNTPSFFFFLIMFLGAMNGLVLSNELTWVYFFWEVTTFVSFMLISYPKTKEALKNGVRALWMNSLGGLTFVVAILALHLYGSHITTLTGLIEHGGAVGLAAVIALGCLVFASFTKTAQLPFQSWLLGAMVAPTPVSALLHSSAMVKAGVYLVVRLAPMFAIQAGEFMGMSSFGWIGLFTALVGGITFAVTSGLAITVSNAKHVLAYSTIGSLGLIIACATFNSALGLVAAILMIIFHAISKALMFLSVGAIEHQIGSRDVEDMRGLTNRLPILSTIAFLGMVTMLLPPFGVLISKWAAMEAATVNPIIALLLVIGSVLSIIFWGRWMGNITTTHYSKGTKQKEKESILIYIPLFVLIIGAFVFSILIPPVINFIMKALDPSLYAMYQTTPVVYDDMFFSQMAIGSNVGVFPILPIFIVLGLILLLTPILLGSAKREKVSLPYYGGEGVDDPATPKFYSTADAPVTVTFGNYYLKNFFGQARLGKVGEIISILIIATMFGVMFINTIN